MSNELNKLELLKTYELLKTLVEMLQNDVQKSMKSNKSALNRIRKKIRTIVKSCNTLRKASLTLTNSLLKDN
jgi:hypothetical protein